MRAQTVGALVVFAWCMSALASGPPVTYVLAFPEPLRRYVLVEATFTGLDSGPVELRMSRTSPGRYALHEFARNVWDFRAVDGGGRSLPVSRPDPHQWDVSGHDGTVRVTYKVYGDVVDGTYLAVDDTHAHLNMPAALMWARGLEQREMRVILRQPAGRRWTVATQLFPTDDPLSFTAPNLSYLLDSPVEFGPLEVRSFTVPACGADRSHVIRVALHEERPNGLVDTLTTTVGRIVDEQRAMMGELPTFEPGHYTFLIDTLPWARSDGMEHRNSTVITTPATGSGAPPTVVSTMAHELFHAWNVERIRPRSLEPFSFERPNPSRELWLAEGVTSYIETLTEVRAGTIGLDEALSSWSWAVNPVVAGRGRRFRSAAEMSLLAQFVDGARWNDRSNADGTFLSYYTYGHAIGLALDLSLRARSDGRIGIDEFLRAMWIAHGKPGAHLPGHVDRPYTIEDVRSRLAEVSGDRRFADEFVSRYVEGQEVADYAALLARAGLLFRQVALGAAWLGDLRVEDRPSGVTVSEPPAPASPFDAAGIGEGDVIRSIDDVGLGSVNQLYEAVRRKRADDRLRVVVEHRSIPRPVEVALASDPRMEIVPVERTGGTLSSAQRTFRNAWLASRAGKCK